MAASSSMSSGVVPPKPACGMASKMCSSASTPAASSLRCIRTVLDKNRCEVYGFAPTGKRLTFRGLASLRIVDAKIVRIDGFSDIRETLSRVS
jgi:hypothetical protein